MKRKKTYPTRRRQALFWSAVVLVLLALLRLTTGDYALLPIQALRGLEEGHGFGRTEVLRRSLDLREGQVDYLAVNEHVLVFANVEPTWLGWELARRDVVDCGADTSLCGTGERACALGRAADDRIVTVEHTFWFAPWVDSGDNEGEPELYTCATGPDDWYEWDGNRYFLLEYDSPGRGYYKGGRLIGYDAAGHVLAEVIIG